MRDLLDGASGERLVGDAYGETLNKDFWEVGEPGFWKLERLQTFQEPYSESWTAFIKGDWEEALLLHEARRPSLEDTCRKIAEHGFNTWWVRVAEKPITPYLQWEFHLLRLRNQCGDNVRVISLDQIERFEESGRVPEIITLGTEVMYEIMYDENRLPEGGIRFVNRDLIVRCQKFIQDLYSVGEDLEIFFEREVAVLEPPRGE